MIVSPDKGPTHSRFDGVYTHLFLIGTVFCATPPSLPIPFYGQFARGGGRVVAVDMSTRDGARVDVMIVEE